MDGDDNMLSAQDYKNCEQYGLLRFKKNNMHPLKIVIDCKKQEQIQSDKINSLEQLTQWLAQKVLGRGTSSQNQQHPRRIGNRV